jgi:hypothetical protein
VWVVGDSERFDDDDDDDEEEEEEEVGKWCGCCCCNGWRSIRGRPVRRDGAAIHCTPLFLQREHGIWPSHRTLRDRHIWQARLLELAAPKTLRSEREALGSVMVGLELLSIAMSRSMLVVAVMVALVSAKVCCGWGCGCMEVDEDEDEDEVMMAGIAGFWSR